VGVRPFWHLKKLHLYRIDTDCFLKQSTSIKYENRSI